MKLGLVGSSGGHLTHLYLLKEFWEQEERFWVTFKKEDAVSLLKEERVFWCYFPTNRNIINFFKNQKKSQYRHKSGKSAFPLCYFVSDVLRLCKILFLIYCK